MLLERNVDKKFLSLAVKWRMRVEHKQKCGCVAAAAGAGPQHEGACRHGQAGPCPGQGVKLDPPAHGQVKKKQRNNISLKVLAWLFRSMKSKHVCKFLCKE